MVQAQEETCARLLNQPTTSTKNMPHEDRFKVRTKACMQCLSKGLLVRAYWEANEAHAKQWKTGATCFLKSAEINSSIREVAHHICFRGASPDWNTAHSPEPHRLQKQLCGEGCLGKTRSELLGFQCHPPVYARQHSFKGYFERWPSITWPQSQMVYSPGTEQSSILSKASSSCTAVWVPPALVFTHLIGKSY